MRDRDPFERTLEALRRRLSQSGPLQGAPLAVNALAAELGVSPTPVREVLARLAGEGLIARQASGYVGTVHDPAGLADLYGLASLLALSALAGRGVEASGADGAQDLQALLMARANPALRGALARVLAQLAPLAQAERGVLGDDVTPIERLLTTGAAAGAIAPLLRRYYLRRRRRAGEILGRALGLS